MQCVQMFFPVFVRIVCIVFISEFNIPGTEGVILTVHIHVQLMSCVPCVRPNRVLIYGRPM